MTRISRPTPAPPKGKVGRVQCEAMGACEALFFARLGTLATKIANFALMGEGRPNRYA